MNPLFAAAADVQSFCRAQGWKSAVIGGLAVQRWGEPRQTRDVDITLVTGIGHEDQYVDALLARYTARIPDARRFGLDRRVVLVETASHVPLDISLGGLPYEARVIDRSTPYDFEPDTELVTCSAEDLVVLKAFASRAQDWLDIEGIIVRQGARLNRGLITQELQPLLALKEDAEAEGLLRRLLAKHP